MVAMNPLTAVGFVLAGLALALQARGPVAGPSVRRMAQAAALLVVGIGVTKLGLYMFGWDAGWDRWLFADRLEVAGQAPNRIAPNTALNFCLVGLALLFLDSGTRPGRRPTEFLALVTGLTSLLAIMGYAYGVRWLYGVAAFIPMALHTAVCFHLMAVGLLCARPREGMMAVFTSHSAAGALLRWQLPGTVLILFGLGWLRLEGERHGLYGTELGVALHSLTTIVIFAGLVGWSARNLHRAERARQREQEERERFFVLSLDLLGIAGLDGYFKRVNPAFAATLGWSEAEFLARPFTELIHPDDVAATLAEVEKLKTGAPTLHFENRYRCKDGTWRWIGWKAQPFLSEGLLYCSGHDTTERREAAAAIQALNRQLEERAGQLEEVNRELEAFSYSVSHDLRAPLRHIQGYADMLLTAAGAQLAERPRRYLETIRQAGEDMGRLIDDLLAFSRVGRVELRRHPVALNLLVDEVSQGLELTLQGRAIEWEIAVLPQVHGDPALLRQVLANLIGNAVKYTRGRTPARIEIGGEVRGTEAVLFVRDNGAGFDERYAHKLFGVFQRLHRADEFEGTGIGLATVRRIVTRHGGRTWAEGHVDRGAVFYFTLPISPALSPLIPVP